MPKLIQIQVQCLSPGSMLLVGSMWRDYPFPPRNGDLGGVQRVCREIWIPLQLMAVWVQSLCPSVCQHRDWSVSAPWFIRTCSTLSQLTHMLVSNDGDDDDVMKMVIWISNWFASARLSVLWPAVAFLKSVLRNSCRPIQTCVYHLYIWPFSTWNSFDIFNLVSAFIQLASTKYWEVSQDQASGRTALPGPEQSHRPVTTNCKTELLSIAVFQEQEMHARFKFGKASIFIYTIQTFQPSWPCWNSAITFFHF